MIGIALIIVVITAAGQASLLNVGGLLILAVLIHNLGGYLLGYGTGKLFKMSEPDCRSIAIEVGMQNGGLASGLANQMGKIATVGLAPAVFGPVMNITGSILASWWGKTGRSWQLAVSYKTLIQSEMRSRKLKFLRIR